MLVVLLQVSSSLAYDLSRWHWLLPVAVIIQRPRASGWWRSSSALSSWIPPGVSRTRLTE